MATVPCANDKQLDRGELRGVRASNDGAIAEELESCTISTTTMPSFAAPNQVQGDGASAPLVSLVAMGRTSAAGAFSTSESFFPSGGYSLAPANVPSRPPAFSPSLRSETYLASYAPRNASFADWSPGSRIPPPSPVPRGMSPTPDMLAILESSTPFLLPPAYVDVAGFGEAEGQWRMSPLAAQR